MSMKSSIQKLLQMANARAAWLSEGFPSLEIPEKVSKISKQVPNKAVPELVALLKDVCGDIEMNIRVDGEFMASILCELGSVLFKGNELGPVVMQMTKPEHNMFDLLCMIIEGKNRQPSRKTLFFAGVLLSTLVHASEGRFMFGEDTIVRLRNATTENEVRGLLKFMNDRKVRCIACITKVILEVDGHYDGGVVFTINGLAISCHPPAQGSILLADVHVEMAVVDLVLKLATKDFTRFPAPADVAVRAVCVDLILLWAQMDHMSGQLSVLPHIMAIADTLLKCPPTVPLGKRTGAILAMTVATIRPDSHLFKFNKDQWETVFDTLCRYTNFLSLRVMARAVRLPPLAVFITPERLTRIIAPEMSELTDAERTSFIDGPSLAARQQILGEFLTSLFSTAPRAAAHVADHAKHPKFVDNLIACARGAVDSIEVRVVTMQHLFAVFTEPMAIVQLLAHDAATAEAFREEHPDFPAMTPYPMLDGLVAQLHEYVASRSDVDKMIQTLPPQMEEARAAQGIKACAGQALAVFSALAKGSSIRPDLAAESDATVADLLRDAGLLTDLTRLLAAPIGGTDSHLLDVILLMEQLLSGIGTGLGTTIDSIVDSGAIIRLVAFGEKVMEGTNVNYAEEETKPRFEMALTYTMSVLLFIARAKIDAVTNDTKLAFQMKKIEAIAVKIVQSLECDRICYCFSVETLRILLDNGVLHAAVDDKMVEVLDKAVAATTRITEVLPWPTAVNQVISEDEHANINKRIIDAVAVIKAKA
ncbi:hypothetical protein J8273_5734 [Carpediemonas membranifera]|uniref:Uncharacterized protein n=1 Tax=Carpediemonas membranifera TaxID=201153 RepID=A0A8J6B9S3_9EUKA|nr:hypothetical protein J8273_5734 [Carpediemonas membranifera]|eukprot:KAG9392922.1 hypothetical protein J8273_5734 [Carpediemonas membranifera]